jgi:hypothetical protein
VSLSDIVLSLLFGVILGVSQQPFYFTIGACAVALTITYIVRGRRQ